MVDIIYYYKKFGYFLIAMLLLSSCKKNQIHSSRSILTESNTTQSENQVTVSGSNNIEFQVTKALKLPDLVVKSLAYANGIFKAEVKNKGTAPTPSDKTIGIGYYVNGNYQTLGKYSGSLAAGATIFIGTNGSPYIIPDGSHKIKAIVDDAKRINELDESNNVFAMSVTIKNGQIVDNSLPPPELPDVVVTSVNYNTSTNTFTSTIKNQGTAATPSGVVIAVAYSVDGKYKTWGGVKEQVAPGASVTIGTNGSPYVIPEGSHTIMAFVDDMNRFEESNENNNTLSKVITISGSTPPPSSSKS